MPKPQAKFEIRAEDRTSKGIASVKKRITNLFGSIQNLGKKAQFALAGLFAGISAGAAKSIKDNINYADSLAKLEDRLGILPEKLSALDYAAKRANVNFNTLTIGMQRMTRRVAEAAKGTGEAKGAIEELGLSAEELAQLSPDEQFIRIAEAISQVGSTSDRVRLAMKLFDSEGVKLLQTMTDGAQGIRNLMAEAEALGVTVSSETAKQAALFNDQLAELQATAEGLGRSLAEKAIPKLTELLNIINLEVNGPKNYLQEIQLELMKIDEDMARLEKRRRDPLLSLFYDEDEIKKEIVTLQIRADNLREHNKVLTESAAGEKKLMDEMKGARKQYQEIVVEEQKQETQAIKAELREQEQAFQRHIQNIKSLSLEVSRIEAEFAGIVSKIQLNPDVDHVDWIDAAKKIGDARIALDRQEFDKAIELARQGGKMVLELQENGEGASVALLGLAKTVERVGVSAAKGKLDAEIVKKSEVEEQIKILKNMLKDGVSTPISLDSSQIEQQVSGAMKKAQELANRHPVTIPIQVSNNDIHDVVRNSMVDVLYKEAAAKGEL
ncbi:MAG: hypothetical protein ABW078_08950 [Sedimenticola sp.]